MSQPAHSNRQRKRATSRKDDVIKIRTTAETRAILSRAAMLRGQKLSEFMLDSARRRAEETILDQRVFFLNAKDHERFLAMLENPIMPTKEMRARANRKRPWER
jgi:uncharacterized protein (DUF1778 family)